jgi:hypothetical protein
MRRETDKRKTYPERTVVGYDFNTSDSSWHLNGSCEEIDSGSSDEGVE